MTHVGAFDSFEEMLNSLDASDIKVICGERTWNLHKAILCRSPFFKTVLSSDSKETVDNDLTLPDHKSHEVQGIITFIYTGKVTTDLEKDESIEAYIRMFELGAFFGLGDVCTYALDKVRSALKHVAAYVNSLFAKGDPSPTIPPEMFNIVSQVAYSAYVSGIDSKTYSPLREKILSFWAMTGMRALKLSQIQELLDKMPKISVHLLKALTDKTSPIGAFYRRDHPTHCIGCGERLMSYQWLRTIRLPDDDESSAKFRVEGWCGVCHEKGLPGNNNN
ncbi:hypothetical protein PG988_006740 [Apiospora saccharicola]